MPEPVTGVPDGLGSRVVGSDPPTPPVENGGPCFECEEVVLGPVEIEVGRVELYASEEGGRDEERGLIRASLSTIRPGEPATASKSPVTSPDRCCESIGVDDLKGDVCDGRTRGDCRGDRAAHVVRPRDPACEGILSFDGSLETGSETGS